MQLLPAALLTVRELVGDGEPLPTQTGYLVRAEGWAARALSAAAGAEYFLQAAANVEQPNLWSRLLYEAQRSGADAARQFIAAGRVDSARRAFTRVSELYVPDPGADMPVIDGLSSVSIELTRRAAQIASLAGRGFSHQEIAEQFVLSVPTVETYVYRAMQKRGVDNRHEL